jgi:hypothetical protein
LLGQIACHRDSSIARPNPFAETSPSIDLIVAGQRLLGFDSSKSSSTANVRWTWFIDIAVDGQSYSWAFYIDITFDGQRPLDFHLVDSSSTARLTPGLSSSTSPLMANVRWT